MANNQGFSHLLQQRQQRIDQALRKVLQGKGLSESLQSAMQYATLNGGKRLRPQLAYAAAEAISGSIESADIPACAVELMHAYSLVHDDLPAMDNDVLRRGKPTCHIAFDEATAILAGDALQTLAFELLAASPLLPCGNNIRLQLIIELSQASGHKGMVGGQALDMAATGHILDEAALGLMHSMKTGALIRASVICGALSTNLASPAQLSILRTYAELAGLAFQIRDDILDVESTVQVSGKQPGKDARLNKLTYTSLLGMDGAKQKLEQTTAAALEALQNLGANAGMLRQLTRLIAERKA